MALSASELLVPYTGPWTEREARHLLNRTGFSARISEVDDALRQSLATVLEERLNDESRPDAYPRPEWAVAPTPARAQRQDYPFNSVP